MDVLALISDLATQSHVTAAGTRTGAGVQVAGTVEGLLAAIERSPPRLLVIDLSHPGLAVEALVPRLRALVPAARIVAFGPHVHKDRLAAAEMAGCDTVISRGQFHAQVDELIRPAL